MDKNKKPNKNRPWNDFMFYVALVICFFIFLFIVAVLDLNLSGIALSF